MHEGTHTCKHVQCRDEEHRRETPAESREQRGKQRQRDDATDTRKRQRNTKHYAKLATGKPLRLEMGVKLRGSTQQLLYQHATLHDHQALCTYAVREASDGHEPEGATK